MITTCLERGKRPSAAAVAEDGGDRLTIKIVLL